MRKDAAEQCRLLLAAAGADLKRRQASGDAHALTVSDIGIQSAYRSIKEDTEAWNAAFATHFGSTRQARAKLKGGEYGAEAVFYERGCQEKTSP